MPRVKLLLDKKAVTSIGMAAYLGRRDLNPATVYGRMGNMEPAWDGVRDVIFQSNEETFAKEGAKAGFESWHNDYDFTRDQNYLDWKSGRVGHTRLMELTGYLRGQMTGVLGDHFERRTMNSFEMGSDAPTHPGSGVSGEDGINIPDPSGEDIGGLQAHDDDLSYVSPGTNLVKNRPAHTIFRITESDLDEICEQMLDHITHARRLGARFNVRPSRAADRQGHFVVRRGP